jgi:hypothetical protein
MLRTRFCPLPPPDADSCRRVERLGIAALDELHAERRRRCSDHAEGGLTEDGGSSVLLRFIFGCVQVRV